MTVMPAEIPRLNGIALDGRVLGFAFVISVLSRMSSALQASKIDLMDSLKENWSRTLP